MRMQRRWEAAHKGERAEGLEKCEFESGVEVVHAVHAAQPQLLRESAYVFRARDAEQLAGCVGLSCGDHAAHGVDDMEMQRGCRCGRKQLDEQLLEGQVLMGCEPVIIVGTRFRCV